MLTPVFFYLWSTMQSPFLLLASWLLMALLPDPKFEAQVIDNAVGLGYGLAIGDVDGDGKADILMADKKQFVWYRNGDWKRFVMVENLTESDNVCIAARDIDGDGKVEVAVGAQWNPSETSDTLKSGSVHFLRRPADPTQRWTPLQLHHEPTIHRMRWVKTSNNRYHLIVVPLHGRGNQGGTGAGVKVIAYEMPDDPAKKWKYWTIDESMHMTHNLDVVESNDGESIYIGGKEGVKVFVFRNGQWSSPAVSPWFIKEQSFGEIRIGKRQDGLRVAAGVEPMHGNLLTVYQDDASVAAPPVPVGPSRLVLTHDLNQGHALAISDLLRTGMPQIVVGWREPNAEKKTGIKMFIASSPAGSWSDVWIDENGIACEDLQIADLDGDGRKDIIASGRASHNLKIYWNKSK